MRTFTLKLTLAIFSASAAVSGCASQTPYLDKHFGEAVNAAKAQQVISLDASLNNDPVAGMDGKAANASVSRYYNSFIEPPATTNVFNLGVGASGGTSSGPAQ